MRDFRTICFRIELQQHWANCYVKISFFFSQKQYFRHVTFKNLLFLPIMIYA